MRIAALAVAALVVSGCAGQPGGTGRALSYDWQTQKVEMPDDTYRLFTHPTDNALLTTPSFSRSFQLGAATGATLFTRDFDPVAASHAAAAQKWLDMNRPGCTVTTSAELIDLTYEHAFECEKTPPETGPET
jgi:hypothetical protein